MCDFMVSSGDLIPEINALYGLRCEGVLALAAFQASTLSRAVSLAEILRTAIEVASSSQISGW
jgi:hypothetical protein